jgi:hypothetical protein
MDDPDSIRSNGTKQDAPEPGRFSLGGETDIDDDAVAGLGALLDRKLAGLKPDCSNDELIDSAIVEAMRLTRGTVRQVRARLLSVAPYRPDAKPSRKRSPRRRR